MMRRTVSEIGICIALSLFLCSCVTPAVLNTGTTLDKGAIQTGVAANVNFISDSSAPGVQTQNPIVYCVQPAVLYGVTDSFTVGASASAFFPERTYYGSVSALFCNTYRYNSICFGLMIGDYVTVSSARIDHFTNVCASLAYARTIENFKPFIGLEINGYTGGVYAGLEWKFKRIRPSMVARYGVIQSFWDTKTYLMFQPGLMIDL